MPAVPETGQSIPNPCIRENGEISRFSYIFDFRPWNWSSSPLSPVTGCFQRTIFNKIAKSSSGMIDFSAIKPNSCSKDVFALQPLRHHRQTSTAKGPVCQSLQKPSLPLAVEIFVLWPERKALSVLLLFLNENVLNHLFDDSSSRTGWSDD